MDSDWAALAVSLGIGLLIGLERERHPNNKAGARTFALTALAGTLAAFADEALPGGWIVAVGLAGVVLMLIAAYWRIGSEEEPGTTTIVAAVVCYLLGVLVGRGEMAIAGAVGIGVTVLLYFKPEIEGLSTTLERREQVSVLQFLMVTFIVLPILPDRAYGPYEVLNPRSIWLMVVLISGIGLASYMALRLVGQRHGALLAGALGGLVSSTATTVAYGRASRDSAGAERTALLAVPVANLVPLVRAGVLAAILAPALLFEIVPVLAAALLAGGAVYAVFLGRGKADGKVEALGASNPAQIGTALQFGALYAVVQLASAWLSDVAGNQGLYVAALVSGLVDLDAITLTALNMFAGEQVQARVAVVTIALAYVANVVFKLGVLVWLNRRVALGTAWPVGASIAGGAVALAFV